MAESETRTIAGVILVLGLIALFAIMLYGDSGPIQPFAPTFPVFQNPFDQRGYFTTASLTDSRLIQTIPTHSSYNQTNCGNISYFNCLTDASGPDYNASYISLNSANQTQFNFTSGFYPDSTARPGIYAQGVDWTKFHSFRVELWCRWSVAPTNGNTTIAVIFVQDVDARNHAVFGADDSESCAVGSAWTHQTFIDDSFAGAPDTANAQMSIDIDTEFFTTDGVLDVSTVYINLYFTGVSTCNGSGFFGDISCQLVNFGNFIVDVFHFVLNVIIFGGQWVITISEFLGNFFAVIVWLYAIPGMPEPIQLFVDVILTVYAGIILLSIAKLVRGNE